MTDRELAFTSLGIEYAEGIDLTTGPIVVPSTGREIRRTSHGWTVQPWNDNYWLDFTDLLEALRAATPP